MKVLLLSQGKVVEEQPDYDLSFRNAHDAQGVVNIKNIPYISLIDKFGLKAFYHRILEENERFKPDLIFFQFFHIRGDKGIAECCQNLRASQHRPLIFGSVGDPFYTGLKKYLARPIPSFTLTLARHSDAFFSTSMGNIADQFVLNGCKNIFFLPHAFCPAHFPDWELLSECEKKYDVVMVGSRGRLLSRRPYVSISNTLKRKAVVTSLKAHFGERFSIFGHGWSPSISRGSISFKEQVKLFASSRVAIDAPSPILETDYYASDRPFFILGSGTPLVFFRTPRIDKIFRENEHAYYVDRIGDAASVCDRVLELPDDVIAERLKNVKKIVRERHLIDHRIDTIISVAEVLNRIRSGELSLSEGLRSVRMWHFLPEVEMSDEIRYCVRNWQG